MGRIVTAVRVANFVEPDRELRVDALVDTGAYGLTLPRKWKHQLGEFPIVRKVDLETADGRIVQGEVCGPATIQIEGFDKFFGEVVFLDVDAADDAYEPLLGYVALEQSQAAVDRARHQLVKIRHLDLK
jgi:predicted aspartyl protease